MSAARLLTHNLPELPAVQPELIDGLTAEKLTSLSEKTLKRAAQRGEKVGRVKVGASVRYHVATLREWLAAQVAAAAV